MSTVTHRWFVIGLGRVGSVFAAALDDRGLLSGAWTRSVESAVRASERLGRDVQQGGLAMVAGADAILVTLPDACIGPYVRALPGDVRDDPSRVWLHASGALDRRVLADAGVAGPCGSVHPLRSISDPATPASDLRHTFFALEGDPQAVARARSFVELVGGEPHELPSDAKSAYHAAATLASNGVYALLAASRTLIESAGIRGQSLERALASLARQSAANAEALSVERAVTGPVVRGDASTVLSHVTTLSECAPELVPLYVNLAERLLELAERTDGLRERDAAAIRSVLSRAIDP